MQPDTRTHYGTISRLLHWGMALAILLMFLMAIAWHINARWQSLIPVHKTLGNALLMLVLFRGIWAIASEQRPRPDNRAVWLGHLALYLLMITVPSAWLLLALIAGHILMTIIHQRRGEKILQRMAGRRNPQNNHEK